MTEKNYASPLDRLLNFEDGVEDFESEWPDYIKEFGLGQENIPDLIRLATDQDLRYSEEDDFRYLAPLHAWRALGQLKALEAAEPLTRTFDWDDDWIGTEMPKVYSMLGPAAVPVLVSYLSDSKNENYPREHAMECLTRIAQEYPEVKDDVVSSIAEQLKNYRKNEPDFNGFLIIALEELKAESTLPLIEEAFKAGAVDIGLTDWDSTQFRFGLIPEEEYKKREEKNNQLRRDKMIAEMGGLPELLSSEPARPSAPSLSHRDNRKDQAKAKAKRKMAAASRKKNRKRK